MPPPQLIELNEEMRNAFLNLLNEKMDGKLKPGVITSIKHWRNRENDVYTIRLGLNDGDYLIFSGKVLNRLNNSPRSLLDVVPTLDNPFYRRNQFEDGPPGNAAYQSALEHVLDSDVRLSNKIKKIYDEGSGRLDLNRARGTRIAILRIGATALEEGSVSTTRWGGKRSKKTRRVKKRKITRRRH